MKQFLPLLALLVLLTARVQAQGPDHVPGEVMVMVQPHADIHRVVIDLAQVNGVVTGLKVDREVSAPMRTWLLRFDQGAVNDQLLLRTVQNHDAVQLAQFNHYITERVAPNDTQYGQQWHHQNIDSEVAWDVTTGGVTATGDTIVVAIMEGADLTHADMTANAWHNWQEIAGNGIDDDGNGYIDDFRGWNTPGNNDVVYTGAHGTEVAGMIGGAGNNNLGVAGANWNVKMMPVQYGNTQEAQVVAAYTYPLVMRRRYNASNGATGAFVVATNASWGIDGGQPSSSPLWCAMYDTLGTAGILNCGATANNAVDVDVVGDLPTACPSDFMVSVTATNNVDQRTFSAYGLTTIDVGAPGASVYTTQVGDIYGSVSGTSFASPLTAGVIALLYSAPCSSLMDLVHADPMGGALYVRGKLFEGVEQVGNLPGNTVTGGRINAGNSINAIMSACGSCPVPFGGTVSRQGADGIYSWISGSTGPFNIQYRAVGSTTWIDITNVNATSVTVNGLDACAAYEFQVMLDCGGGDTSLWSNSTILTAPLETAPSITPSAYPIFCAGDPFTLTSSATSGVVWSTNETTQVISPTQSGTYTVTFNGACGTYTSAPVDVTVIPVPVAPSSSGVQLPGAGTATLDATGTGIQWYDAATGGSNVGNGNSFTTPFLTATTSYWCASSAGSVLNTVYGGRTNNTTSGQYQPNGNNWLRFTASQPFTIHSVKVYASGAGDRSIALVDANSNVVAQGIFTIPDGESRVQLEFTVPSAGDYGLRILTGDPQLWRDGQGSNPTYPYSLGVYGSIIGTTVAGGNTLAYYYFFYDWEVSNPGVLCESARVQVTVEVPQGVQEIATGSSLRAYPSPADRELFVEAKGSAGRLNVVVVDGTGRQVLARAMENGRASIGVAALSDGLYFYRVLRNAEEVGVGRFLVDHR